MPVRWVPLAPWVLVGPGGGPVAAWAVVLELQPLEASEPVGPWPLVPWVGRAVLPGRSWPRPAAS
eukprot:11895350-Alexandrium_andersonii.AAC.1